jgi:hypothetical protein
MGGIDNIKPNQEANIPTQYVLNCPTSQIYPLALSRFLESNAIGSGLCRFLSSFRLFVNDVDSPKRNEHPGDRGEKIQAIEAILAGIVGISSFVF